MTQLDLKLQEMAAKNWDQFTQLIGKEAILSAKICLLRQSGMSYGQIITKLGVSKKKVRYRCDVCPPLAQND